MKILLTGGSGFLGRVIAASLKKGGNHVVLLGRGKESDIISDLRFDEPIISKNEKFDLVVHCAGKAHIIPKTEEEKQDFYAVNVMGTQNLIKSLTTIKPKYFVLISSVAVYGLNEGENISEDTPLKAVEPYGHSKILAEKLVLEWGEANNIIITVLRLPIIVGHNSIGNLRSMIQGIMKGYYFNIGGGKARKSMVLATDVAENITNFSKVGGIFNLTDGEHPSFKDLGDVIADDLGKKRPRSIPFIFAKRAVQLYNFVSYLFTKNKHQISIEKLTKDLIFSDTKARVMVNWKPSSVLLNIGTYLNN